MNCDDPIKSSFDSNNNLFKVEEHEKLIVSLREGIQNDSDYKIDKESVDSSDREVILEIFEGTSENESSCHVEKTITWQIDTLLQTAMKTFEFAMNFTKFP